MCRGRGFGCQLVPGDGIGTYLNLGAFISAIIYFIIYMAVVYFMIVMPYKLVMFSTRQNGVWRPCPDQDLPCVPFRRREPRSKQVQALRHRHRQGHSLIA